MEIRHRHHGLIGLAAIFAAFFFVIWLTGSGTLCFTRTMTGLPCPGCGLTTAAKSLLHGELRAAFAYHPLWPGVVAVALVCLFRNKVGICGRLHRNKYFYLSIVAAFVLLFVVRLVLYFPNGPYPMVITDHSLYHTLRGVMSTILGK